MEMNIKDESIHTKDDYIQRLLKIINNIPTGVGIFEIIDNQPILLYLNDAFYRLLGYKREDRIAYTGKNFFDSMYPGDIDFVKKNIKEIIAGKKITDFSYRVMNSNQNYSWLRIEANREEEQNGRVIVYCSFTSIDNYMEDKIKLEKKQAVINIGLKSSELEFWEYDYKTKKITLTESVRKNDLFDITIGNVPDYFIKNNFIEKGSIDNFKKMFIGDFKGKESISYDILFNQKEKIVGQWKRFIIAPVYNEDNKLIACVGTSTDITEIKKREEDTIEQLKIAKSEIERASQQRTDFFNQMSHNFRTPLNAVVNLSAMAKEKIDEKEVLLDYINNINSASELLLELINNGLDYEKIEANKMTLSLKPYNLSSFEKTIDAIILPLAKKKNIEFNKSCFNFNYCIVTDAMRFKQIFINLLSNAIKYTSEGGKIQLESKNEIVEDGYLTCDYIVRDNGIGMSEEFQKIMFEPFSQEKKYSSSSGSGLGLLIVKNFVELMKGKLSVKSSLNKGSEFTVHLTFPILENNLEKKENNQEKVLLFKGKKVLLVEDNSINIIIAKKFLEKTGIKVIVAENGKEAIEIYKASKVDEFFLIFMDIHMPIMDGFQTTKMIRSLKREDAKTIQIVAMSANVFEEDVEKSLKSGMNYYLSKPIDSKALFSILEKTSKENNNK